MTMAPRKLRTSIDLLFMNPLSSIHDTQNDLAKVP